MLLFHGTQSDSIESILEQGLKALYGRDQPVAQEAWQRALTAKCGSNFIYLSTQPVAGKGGDPIHFALGWPLYLHKRPGYLVVVDLPSEKIHAQVENLEIDRLSEMFRMRRFFGEWNAALQRTHWQICYWAWSILKREKKGSPQELRSRIIPRLIDQASELKLEDSSWERWREFLQEYSRLDRLEIRGKEFEKKQKQLLNKYKVRFPHWIEEEGGRCILCIEHLMRWEFVFEGLERFERFQALKIDKEASHFIPPSGESVRFDVEILSQASLLWRIFEAHFAHHPSEKIEAFFERKANKSWEEWYQVFPADSIVLPRVWKPNLSASDFSPSPHAQDAQVLVEKEIPPTLLRAIIQISDEHATLLPRFKPNRKRGETLSSKIWKTVHELLKEYRGKAVVLKG